MTEANSNRDGKFSTEPGQQVPAAGTSRSPDVGRDARGIKGTFTSSLVETPEGLGEFGPGTTHKNEHLPLQVDQPPAAQKFVALLQGFNDEARAAVLKILEEENHLIHLAMKPMNKQREMPLFPEALQQAFLKVPSKKIQSIFEQAVQEGDAALAGRLIEFRSCDLAGHFSSRYLLGQAPDLAMAMVLLHGGMKVRVTKGTNPPRSAVTDAIESGNSEKEMLFTYIQAIDAGLDEVPGSKLCDEEKKDYRAHLMMVVSTAMSEHSLVKMAIANREDGEFRDQEREQKGLLDALNYLLRNRICSFMSGYGHYYNGQAISNITRNIAKAFGDEQGETIPDFLAGLTFFTGLPLSERGGAEQQRDHAVLKHRIELHLAHGAFATHCPRGEVMVAQAITREASGATGRPPRG